MAELLSDAMKKNQCKGLLRLIDGLTDKAGWPKSAWILSLAEVKGKLLQIKADAATHPDPAARGRIVKAVNRFREIAQGNADVIEDNELAMV